MINLATWLFMFPRAHMLRDMCDYATDVVLLTSHFRILYIYLTLKIILNEKVVNCKIVDLVECYNFDVDFVSIRRCYSCQIWFENLYWIFGLVNHLKLKSCQQQILDLFKLYNFHIKFTFVRSHMPITAGLGHKANYYCRLKPWTDSGTLSLPVSKRLTVMSRQWISVLLYVVVYMQFNILRKYKNYFHKV
jgi:hypothetical protein